MINQLAAICVMGAAQEIVWIASYAIGPFRDRSDAFLALALTAFGLCLWSFFRLPVTGSRAALVVVAFGLLFRLTVLPAIPYQSEDVYRYLWDARVSSMGYDPYRYPPEAPELERVRDQTLYPKLNSKSYATAYPPLSQILFRLSYGLFGDRVTPMKAVFSLLEFFSLLIAWKLLRLWGASLTPLYLMAWNPFFIFEFSHSGHSDSSMILLLMLSLYLFERSTRFWAWLSYAGAFLAKLHPALWLPLYLRRAGLRPAILGIVAATLAWFAFFTPSSTLSYFRSLGLYFHLFEFNSSIHYLLSRLGHLLTGHSWDQQTGPYLAGTLLVLCAAIGWRFPIRSSRDMLHAGFWIMTVDLCLATTVHPWYLSWAAFAVPMIPYAFMVYWTGACFLSYLAYGYRPVYEPAWVLLVEYLPVYALMIFEICRGRPILESWIERRGT